MPAKTAKPAPPLDESTRRLLMEASLTIASFRWRLEKAGYPFREPPAVGRILAQIDGAVYPDENRKSATQ